MSILSILTKLVLLFLVGLSIYSVRVMLDRFKALKRVQLERAGLAPEMLEAIRPFSKNSDRADRAFQSFVIEKRAELEEGLTGLATIGSNAPFVGLFGTVLGIIEAFGALSEAATGGQGVMGAISEALIATAVGLLVAMPAVAAYNVLSERIEALLQKLQAQKERFLAEGGEP